MKKQAKRAQERKSVRLLAGKRRSRGAATRPKTASVKPKGLPSPHEVPAPRVLAAPTAKPTVQGDPVLLEKQRQLYEEAVCLFQAQKFDKADALFQKVAEGLDRTLAHHAQTYSQICHKRLRPPEMALKTADDHYNYAVTLINARRLPEAAQHLETALRMAPQADHLHYALAATAALQGHAQEAYERLRTAIRLQPRNRILARSDADFAGILGYPPLASLLQIDRG